jgi:Alanine dehydrogenase/PNT, N-terminal domain/Alanine dehydrogenase/PNT, C-terminal domain
MIIGVPKEIKEQEQRVGLLPSAADQLKRHGHSVIAQTNAGVGSGYADEEYKQAGAEIIDSAEEIFKRADMIVKVKEPLSAEFPLLRKGQILFTYLHLAASKPLTEALLKSGVTGIAYETIQVNARLPLLEPMSEVAGRMSVVMGANYLAKYNGGSGVLLGGVPGVLPGRVVVIGAGTSGVNALRMAKGLGADVTILDIDVERLRFLDVAITSLHTLYSHARLRSVDRRGLVARSQSTEINYSRDVAKNEARQRVRGHFDRSGRLRRDVPANHSRQPGLCRRRRDPLLCGQYAGGLRPDLYPGPDQCDVSVYPIAGRLRGERRLPEAADPQWRNQHPRWQADLSGCR